jgi:hypothetical protein
VAGRTGTAAWAQLPFHVYNFDFASLNFAWRHLASPRAPFSIGVVDPTFRSEGDVIFYRGAADVAYVGEESLHGKTCRKYRITGPGIGGVEGTIWEDPKSGWLEKIAIPFPDNPDWASFLLELQGVEVMTPAAWKAFIADSLADANGAKAKTK